MNVIDPFEFRDRFSATRSFAVVGNAPAILEHENGATIDSHDIVVRFNRAATTGFESKIGSRTDILVVNANNSAKLGAPPSETVKPRCLVTYVSPQGVRDHDLSSFRDWVGDIPILMMFGPDLLGMEVALRTRPLTSGTYFLFMLTRMLRAEKLFVTGFTMFGAVGSAGPQKYYKDDRPGVGTFHDLDQETVIFARLLADFPGELNVTGEVAELVEKGGLTLKRNDAGCITRSPEKEGLGRRCASALSWRLLSLGMKLRRIAES